MAMLGSPTDFDLEEKGSGKYDESLERAILQYLEKINHEPIDYETLVKEFGGYPQVKDKLKQLMFQNKIVVEHYNGEPRKIRLAQVHLSTWDTLDSMPCFACSRTDECGMDNPVNPVTCKEFNEWLEDSLILIENSYEA